MTSPSFLFSVYTCKISSNVLICFKILYNLVTALISVQVGWNLKQTNRDVETQL